MNFANDGQRRLVALGNSLAEVARPCGVSKQSAKRWRDGELVPGVVHRRTLEREFGIPSTSWEQPAGGGPVEASAVSSAPPADPVAVAGSIASAESRIAELADLLASVRTQRKEPGLLATEMAKLASTEGGLVERIARLEAARRAEMSMLEARVIREHPHWRRVRSILVEALGPYRDAARAVASALEKVDAVA